MADAADRADRLIEQALSLAVAEITAAPRERQLTADGVVFCLDCDGEVPAERLRANPKAVRCIDCQIRFERYENGL